MFIIGIDPHKGSHTASVIDRDEQLVSEMSVQADRRQRDRPQVPVSQRDDRRRTRVVRVCLVLAAGVQQPCPCRQRRRDVEHDLARRD